MKMKPDDTSYLEYGLRNLPDRTPPPDLQKRIMAALPGKKRESQFKRTIRLFGSKFFPASTEWRMAVATVCLLISFYGGTQFNRLIQSDVAPLSGQTLATNITNGASYFYLGRSLLSSGQAAEALKAFRRAEMVEPEKSQYALWQGAAYHALGDIKGERLRYEQLLKKRPDLLVAKLNLAHNLLQDGELVKATQLYDQVLQGDPRKSSALYNRAIALHLQNKRAEEKEAWKEYLDLYRTGASADKALQHLYETGDYSYRQYQIGYKTVILNQERLLGGSDPELEREIDYLVSQTDRRNVDELNVVIFVENNDEQARRKAQDIRLAITQRLTGKNENAVRISWFGEPELADLMDKGPVKQPRSVLIFGALKNEEKKETII